MSPAGSRSQTARRPVALRALVVLTALVFLVPVLSGCLGIERTEWAFASTQISDLADDGLTGSGIKVGIVDSGIDATHPSLDHIPILWRDYLNSRETPYDDSGHGSHVAGILAAKGGVKDFFSGADITGVAPDIELVVVKACGPETCDPNAVERGIDWAVSQGVDILTLSLGGEQVTLNLGDNVLRAVNRAAEKGVYVVVAAGNSGSDHGDVESPSSARNAIAVGAVSEQLQVASFSSRGSDARNSGTGTPLGGVGGRDDPNKKPELVAPGVDILSAWRDGTYAKASGTSQAAPFVAGTIALMLEKEPQWRRANGGDVERVQSMKSVLTETAKKLDGQTRPHDTAAGYGLLQADAAAKRLAATATSTDTRDDGIVPPITV